MIDKLLEVGACFDWISPLLAWAGDLAHGGGHTFLIPLCDLTGREIAAELRRHGVESWGHMIVNQTIMLTVPKPQAAQATAILEGLGVPIESGAVTSGPAVTIPRPRQPRPRRLVGRSRLWRLLE